MSESEKGDLMIEEADGRYKRTNRYIWLGRILVGLLIVMVLVIQGFTYLHGQEREEEINALQEKASESSSAAVEVAEDKQRQARSITELCEAGAIEQDDAGKAVCEDAAKAAETDPSEAVTQAKAGPQGPRGATGPTGPRGPAGETGPTGPPGEDGAEGATGSEGEPGETGPIGEQGDTGDPGTAGEDGATGDTGPAGTDGATGPAGPPGEQGPPGDTGPAGPAGDTGPAGPAGPPGPAGEDGTDGRGIASITCNSDGQWVVTYTDDETETVTGPCRVITTPEPEPTTEATE